ncbi:hypothetical protein SLS62_007867 [Diatrype stigma]|uniref:Uncharacterized protein n=1 Tax=Diatrype stigma TaxID=117547 RepID=A0AAN9UP30_9PEZI
MHPECLRHIKNTVPNWEEIFDQVQRDQQAAQQSKAAACESDDATATAQATVDSQTTEPAPKGKAVNSSTHSNRSRPELLGPLEHSQRRSASPSPLQFPSPQLSRQDFWATVMDGESPSSSCGTGSDSELEHLLGCKPKSPRDLLVAGVGSLYPEASRDARSPAPTKSAESPLATTTQTSPSTGRLNNISAVSSIHGKSNYYPTQADQSTRGPSPFLKEDNDNDKRPQRSRVQQGRGLSQTSQTPENPHDDRELGGYDGIACNISDPWINYQNLWGGDDGVTKGDNSKIADLVAENIDDDPDMLQHALSMALLVSGNTTGGLPIRGKRDGSESPSKKRKLG